MEKYILQGDSDKPFVSLDPQEGVISMKGSSLPENIFEVYKPILKWLEDYSHEPKNKTVVEFFFDYLNTSSTNMMCRIVEMIDDLKEDTEIEFKWCYASGDYDIRDLGIDILEETSLEYKLEEKESLSIA